MRRLALLAALLAALLIAATLGLTLAVPPAAAPVQSCTSDSGSPAAQGFGDVRQIEDLDNVEHYDPDEVELLARVIWTEARGEPYMGKVAVGAVVVNRLRDPRFPDSIRAMVEAPGQFVVSRGARPGPECIRAAEEALAGRDPTGGALYFYSPSAQCFWIRTRPVIAEIGGHVFAK